LESGDAETPHSLKVEGGNASAITLNGNISSGNNITIDAINGISFSGADGTPVATTRTNLGLADDQISAHFPSESDGTKKIRYPSGITPSSAPSSLAIATNTVSMLPFFVDRKTTNFSAMLPTLSCVNPVTINVAVYSAAGGYRSAVLLEQASITISNNTSPAVVKEVTFTNAGKTLERGWYILSAFHTGTNRITNNSLWTVQNSAILGTASIVGTYSPQFLSVTNVTNFPTGFTNTSFVSSGATLIWPFPYY
jgi:hypothetical protein